MEALASIAGIASILLATGFAVGLIDRRRFAPGWLVAAAVLVVVNDALLTNLYGLLPDAFPGAKWNWQGKILALAASLAIAAVPAIGWRNIGLTLTQKPNSLKSAIPVAAVYIGLFILLALAFPGDDAGAETVGFQLSMPGLEEEIFYRGLLLFALDRAFTGRIQFLGVAWGWGALLSSILFGLAHSFGWSDGAIHFDVAIMALTAVPSLLAVWVRLRTGSLLLPIILHNAGNSASLLL